MYDVSLCLCLLMCFTYSFGYLQSCTIGVSYAVVLFGQPMIQNRLFSN